MKLLLLPLVAAFAGGVASAQQPLSISLQPYGPACGPQLGASTADTSRPTVGFEVASTTPNGTVLISIGNRAADLPLTDATCRLLTQPLVTLPIRVRADGTADIQLQLPMPRAGSLYAQAIELGTETRTSQGIAINAEVAETSRARRVAFVRVDSGHYVEFLQVGDDELLVAGGGTDAAPTAVEQFRCGEIDAVDLYRSLTGRPTPDVLRHAQQLANQASAIAMQETDVSGTAAPSDVEQGEVREPDGGGCFSTSWFTSNHCGGPSEFEYCWTNLYGNPWVQRRCILMYGVTACVSGQYVFEYRRKDFGSWRTVWSRTVYSCQWYWVSGSGSRKHRRMHVKYGTGDHKHYSVRGLN